MTSHTVLCSTCGRDCSQHHVMCDRKDGTWCPRCFDKTECGKGKHGEGCPTQVFDDAPLSDEEKSRG